MVAGERYAPSRLSPPQGQGGWDAICIGSGIGGLACAALLARAGKRVLVLEAHETTAGGFTHAFRGKGGSGPWDSGIQCVRAQGGVLFTHRTARFAPSRPTTLTDTI